MIRLCALEITYLKNVQKKFHNEYFLSHRISAKNFIVVNFILSEDKEIRDTSLEMVSER